MSISDKILGLLAPHTCVGGCGTEGALLCVPCAATLPVQGPRCYRCGKFSKEWRTCSACHRHSKLTVVKTATVYEGAAKQLVWKLKFDGARAAAGVMAQQMALLTADYSKDVLLVHVPTITEHVRRRGYDQARLLARHVARINSYTYLSCLRRLGKHHQVGANAKVRRTQLTGVFQIVRPAFVKDAHIILVDDVLTTGATLEVAAAALRRAGAKRVDAIVFTRA